MNYRLRYEGSLGWLVVFAICFFPIALVLLLTNWKAEGNGSTVSCSYNGNTFWLGFWTLFFFPFTIFLLIHNGLNIDQQEQPSLQAAT